MAGRKLNNAAYQDQNWIDETESKNILKIGWFNISLDFDNLIIKAGSSVDIDGVIYVWDVDESISAPTSDGIYYLVITGGSNTISSWTTAEPSYNYLKAGYYDDSDRYIFRCINNSTYSNICNFILLDKEYDTFNNIQTFSDYMISPIQYTKLYHRESNMNLFCYNNYFFESDNPIYRDGTVATSFQKPKVFYRDKYDDTNYCTGDCTIRGKVFGSDVWILLNSSNPTTTWINMAEDSTEYNLWYKYVFPYAGTNFVFVNSNPGSYAHDGDIYINTTNGDFHVVSWEDGTILLGDVPTIDITLDLGTLGANPGTPI